MATTISGAVAQRADLRVEADAAVDRGRPNRALGAVGADALLHLEGELAVWASRTEDGGIAAVRSSPGARGACVRSWRIGRTKAAVLPVPVWAPASRSRPARTSGIASAWTGVGSSVALVRDGAEKLGRQPEMCRKTWRNAPGEALPRMRGPVRARSGSGSDGLENRGADRSAHRTRGQKHNRYQRITLAGGRSAPIAASAAGRTGPDAGPAEGDARGYP